jgi:hypothetical protein
MPSSNAMETDEGLLVSYGCNEQGPYLVVDLVGELPWRREPFRVRGRTFTLEADAERCCTGRYDLATGQSSPCPVRAVLNANLEQCTACFTATGFNPAFYNAPQVSPQQRRRNREPHVVYLASFASGTLKVGMTHAPRKLSRLLEQGARLGAVIGSFEDAERARELEAYVASSFDVAESVRGTRKRQLLSAPFSLSSARAELEQRIEELARERQDVDSHAEILHLDPFYGGAELLEGTLTDLSDTEPLAISGRCLGMIGDVLIALQGAQRYMLSVALLVGRRIRLRSGERQNHFVGQLGLPF